MRSIILLGLKHSGKSSLGQMLARDSGLDFHDSDILLTHYYAKLPSFPGKIDIPSEPELPRLNLPRLIHRAHGKAGFEELEARALEQFLSEVPGPWVLSLGGAAASNPGIREDLRKQNALKVFLDAPEKLLFERILEGGIPSFLEAPSLEESANLWHTMYIQRQKDAAMLANLRVELANLDLSQAYKKLQERIEEYTHARE